jgi:hypothetical protein
VLLVRSVTFELHIVKFPETTPIEAIFAAQINFDPNLENNVYFSRELKPSSTDSAYSFLSVSVANTIGCPLYYSISVSNSSY